MAENNLLLNARVMEVVRAMPVGQQAEIARYSDDYLHNSWGLKYDMAARFGERGRDFSVENYIRPLANRMAWQDLEIAEADGFRAFTPADKMFLGRLAASGAERLVAAYGERHRRTIEPVAVSLSGLHMSFLGRKALAESRRANDIFTGALESYNEEYIKRLTAEHGPATYADGPVPQRSNMFDHIRLPRW